MTWCADEFGEANFGDTRLTKRFIGISQSVLDRPSASLSTACGDWAGAKGAYRFFDNQKVTPEEMLRPHLMKVKSRSNGRNVVLAVQDSTYLNLDSFRCMQGLGFVEGSSTWAHKGLVFHPSLAFSTEGECLGFLGYKLCSKSETRVFWSA